MNFITYISDAAESSFATGCFASDSLVTMADGSLKSIQDLNKGDKVLTADPFTGEITTDTVVTFLDINKNKTNKFTKIIHDNGEITLTDYHLIYAGLSKDAKDSAAIFAKDLTEQHYVFQLSNATLTSYKIRRVLKVTKRGYYAPLTLSGNIIVNGVVSSCYASVSNQWLGHIAMFPVRFFHKLQVGLGTYKSLVFHEDMFLSADGIHWYAKLLIQFFPYLLS